MKEIDFNKQLVPFGKYKGQPVEQVKKVFELSNITLLKFSDVQGGYINAKS